MFVTQLTATQRKEERTTCFSAKQTSWSPSSLDRWKPQNNRQTRKKSEDRERISIFCFSVHISMTLTKLKIKRTKTRAKYAVSKIFGRYTACLFPVCFDKTLFIGLSLLVLCASWTGRNFVILFLFSRTLGN